VYDFLETAVSAADEANADAEEAKVPVSYRVYGMRALEETELWDWGVRRNGFPVMAYVHERAARNCVGSGVLVRRRKGSDLWEAAS